MAPVASAPAEVKSPTREIAVPVLHGLGHSHAASLDGILWALAWQDSGGGRPGEGERSCYCPAGDSR